MKSSRAPAKTLARVVSVLSPSCRQASRLQSESLDRRLGFFESIGLRMHLFLCKWCRRYGKQLKFLHHAAHHCDPHGPSDPAHRLSSEARERMKQKLQSGQ